MASSTLDEWKAIALYHKTQLAAAEKKVEELSPPVEKLLTDSEIKKRVIAMETRTAYKTSWKKAVADGLMNNVFGILEECYQPFRAKDNNDESFMAARALGRRDTLKWQEFKLRVLDYLHATGSFIDEMGGFDTFEDTAGGCDEITWDAGLYILQHPDWVRA